MTTLTTQDRERIATEIKLQKVQKWTIFGIMVALMIVLSLYGFFAEKTGAYYLNIPLLLVAILTLRASRTQQKNILDAMARNAKETITGTITLKRAMGKTPSYYFIVEDKAILLESATAFAFYKKFEKGDRIEINRLPDVGTIIDIKKV